MMEQEGLRSLAGERMANVDDMSDQFRQAPWAQAVRNAELCPDDCEMVMKFQDDNGERYEIAIDDVEFVAAPEEMGDAGKGHSKIHFKEHVGQAAIIVATGVVLGGLVLVRKRRK